MLTIGSKPSSPNMVLWAHGLRTNRCITSYHSFAPISLVTSPLSHTPFSSLTHTLSLPPSLSTVTHRATRHLIPSSARRSKATQHPGCTPPSILTLPVVWTQEHCTPSQVTTAPPLLAPHSTTAPSSLLLAPCY